MGILGCRSMMDKDPSRFCAAFTWNFDTGGPESNQNNNESNSLGLLIDGKSLLYHIALEKKDVLYASPATINESCQVHIHRLLRVVGKKGGVHIFFDGLAPPEKVECQIKRMGEQSMAGDIFARLDIPTNTKVKLLHHLAEWAFVEAIDALQQRFSGTLFMYRPARGEGEVMINQWLVQNDGLYSRVAIISEDSDFLVHESCPGYIPPSSLVYEEKNGRHCLGGTYYLRSKFLRSFLGQPNTADSTVMTTVAALSGCDYVYGLAEDQLEALSNARHKIVCSPLGGLRGKHQNGPTAARTLLAILRVVAHYKKSRGYEWLEHMCTDFAGPRVENTMSALQTVHAIYLYSLQVNPDAGMDLGPGIIEVRRLIQLGIVFCYPLIETYHTRNLEVTSFEHDNCIPPLYVSHLDAFDAAPVLSCPPMATEVEIWITKGSIWNFPHFRQIRTRLYSYIRWVVRNGRIAPTIPPADLWTIDRDPVVKEIVRVREGSRWRMECIKVKIPHHSMMSNMFNEKLLTRDDEFSIDRGLSFCLMGTPHQLDTLLATNGTAYGTAFLASMMLPFNLSCLLLMMSTAPKEMSQWDFPLPAFDSPCCKEVKKVLPMLSVAYAHANLLANFLASIWPNRGSESSMISPPVHISSTFRHDTALLIWDALRLQINLECLTTKGTFSTADTEASVNQYLDGCFKKLDTLRPDDEEWQKAVQLWKEKVSPLFLAWWQIFNL